MKSRSPIFARSILSLLVFPILTFPAFAQTTHPNQSKPLDQTTLKSEEIVGANISEELKPGIVIERLGPHSRAERVGLKEGDILLHWRRGDTEGKFESPFDFLTFAIEQRSVETVTLEGFHDGERREWVWQQDNMWNPESFEIRPNISRDLLALYLEGQEVEKLGRLSQAGERWSMAATRAQQFSCTWLGAWFLFHLATKFSAHGDWKDADVAFRSALEEAEQAGSLTKVHVLIAWASTFFQRQDWLEADKYYQQALRESQKSGDENLVSASILMSLGTLFKRIDLINAENYYGEALALQTRLAPNSPAVAVILNGLGLTSWERGEMTRAEHYYRQELGIEEKLNFYSAGSLHNLALIARYRGDLVKAEKYYRKALEVMERTLPDDPGMANTLDGLGEIARERGNEDEAEAYFRRALTVLSKETPSDFKPLRDRYLGDILDSLGEAAEDRGHFANAARYYEQALSTKEQQSASSVRAGQSLNHLGNVAWERGNLPKAEEYYRRALAIWERLKCQGGDKAQSLAALALIMERKHQPTTAIKLHEEALNAFEDQTSQLGGSTESRSDFRARHANYYKDYIALLVRQEQPEGAFQVLERLRARTLLETISSAHVDIRKGVTPGLVEKEHSLEELINAKSHMQLSGNTTGAEQIAALDKEISDLLAEYKDVEDQIRTSSPGYASLIQPQSLSVKEVQQQLLDANTLLLEYSLGKERSYAFAATPDSLNAYQLPGRAEIEPVARRTYALLIERNRRIKGESKQQRQMRSAKAEADYSHAVAELSQMLLGPLAGQLQGKRLLIVSDGALQYIPFAVLPIPKASNSAKSVPLIAEHEIVNLPSASVLAILRQQETDRKQASREIAVLADPVFGAQDERVDIPAADSQTKTDRTKTNRINAKHPSDTPEESDLDRSAKQLGISGFPRLPFTRREAEGIYAITAKDEALEALDFDASKATALSAQLKDYRIVHFATHGLLNNEHPELSGLVFSLVDKQGKEQDGFLRMLDIYNMELNADLVVLSACQTALGKEIGEEGLIGLTRGFMYAGAPRVVASLWKVDDEATAELMKKFYESMLRDHQTPAQALRTAQQWMRTQKAWQAPYYWAGFVLQGEWR